MKLYTLEEANALLPEVIPVVEAIRDCFVELRALQSAISVDQRGASGDGNLLVNAWEATKGENRIEELNRGLQRAARQLTEWGIELKDPERGLIDFHSEREGEVVYLCYLLGEPTIGHWHTLEGGFAGRQPV